MPGPLKDEGIKTRIILIKIFCSLFTLVVTSLALATLDFLMFTITRPSTKLSTPDEAMTQSPAASQATSSLVPFLSTTEQATFQSLSKAQAGPSYVTVLSTTEATTNSNPSPSTMHAMPSPVTVSPTTRVRNTLKVTTKRPATTLPPGQCTVNNGGCSDICDTAGPKSPSICSCPIGKMLLADMKTCQLCPDGTFGASCTLTCECDADVVCDPVHGTCYCPPGFTDAHCSTPVVECTLGYCLNGGTCSSENNVRLCLCTVHWEADRCDSPCLTRKGCKVENDRRSSDDCFDTGALAGGNSRGSSPADGHETTVVVAILVPLIVAALLVTFLFVLRWCARQRKDCHHGADITINQKSTCDGETDGTDAGNIEPTSFDCPVNDIFPNNPLSNPSLSTAEGGVVIVNSLYSDVSATSQAAAHGEQQTTAMSHKIDNTWQGCNRYETVDLSTDQLDPGHDSMITVTNGTDGTVHETTSTNSVNVHSVAQPQDIHRVATKAAMEGINPVYDHPPLY